MSKSTLSLSFKVEDGKDGIKNLLVDTEGLKDVIKSTYPEVKKLGSQLGELASTTVVFDQLNQAIGQLDGIFKNLAAAYQVQAQVEKQLETVMRERMEATTSDIQSIKDLCSAQQALGVIGDEVQLAGAQQLATFISQRSTLETLIPVMNNLVAQQAGYNATASDATSAATLLGKAMSGNVSALQRMGIYLSDSQKEMLKHGTEAQRAAILTEVITAKVGDMNAQLAATPTGKMEQLENTMGDIKEQMGELVQGVAPFISISANATIAVSGVLRLTASIKGTYVAVTGWWAAQKLLNTELIKSAGTAAAAASSNIALSSGYIKLPPILRAITISYNQASTAAKLFMVATGVGVAILAVSTAISSLSGSADDAASSVDRLADASERASGALDVVKNAEMAATEAGAKAKIQIEQHIQKIKDFKGNKREEKKLLEELGNSYGSTMGYFKDLSAWYNALIKNSQAYCRQMIVEAKTRYYADKIATGEAEYKDLTGESFKRGESVNNDIEKYNSSVADYNSDLEFANNQDRNRWNLGNLITSIADMKWHPIYDDTNYDSRVNSSRAKALAAKQIVDLGKSIDSAYQGLDAALKDAATIEMPVVGTASPQLTGSGNSGGNITPKVEETRLEEISKLIDAKKQAYLSASAETRESIQKEIESLNKEKRGIELLLESAERPISLESLQDYDRELAFLQRLRSEATKDQLVDLDKKIAALQKRKNEFERSSHVEITIDQITTYEDLEKEQRYYSDLLKSATFEERVQIQKRINELNRLKEAWDEVLENLEKPAPIEHLNNIKELQKAVQYYNTLQQKASADEYTETQKTINALQKKIEAIQRGVSLLDNQTEIDKVNQLQGKEYKVKVRSYGFEELTEKIKDLNNQLKDLNNPPTDGQRKMINDQIKVYEKWRAEGVKSFDTYRNGWTSLRGGCDAINSISEAIMNDGSAWQKATAIVESGLQIYDSITDVVALIDMLTVALGLKRDKTMENVEADTLAGATAVTSAGMEATGSGIAIGAKEAETEASHEKTTANVAEAASGVMAAHASIPWVGVAIGAGMLAVMLGLMAGLPKFADGGIAYGPTLGLFGEYAGASSNPEVVAPLNKLKTLIEPRESGFNGRVEFEIDGRKLKGVLRKVENLSLRS